MRRSIGLAAAMILIALPAWAWNGQGHALIGAIADRLLEGTPAANKVHEILGYDLRTASTWPDCLRSIRKSGDDLVYKHVSDDCAPFESAAELERMIDFARRNWSNCNAGGRPCHTAYHFTDVAIQRDRYERAFIGTADVDIVHAIDAALAVLQDKPAPAPFSIRDKKEALLLLDHLVGDLHQPLHVGQIYLAGDGTVVDPDRLEGRDPHAIERQFGTRGGNEILIFGSDLHSQWDHPPTGWGRVPSAEMLERALAEANVPASIDGSATAWAGDTIRVSPRAFADLTFSAQQNGKWRAAAADPAAYRAGLARLQRDQVIKAGARLATLLRALWP